MPEQPSKEHQGQKKPIDTSPVEWAFAGISALLVVAVIGILLTNALAEPATPPDIVLTVDQVTQVASGYLVEFSAHNRGHETAASLVVEGELLSGPEAVETSSTTIDFVPSEATRKAGLFFSHNPAAYQLELNPKGYDQP